MSIAMLGSSRRFLLDRIERLRLAIESLGERLRQSIAQIVGSQIGEAIREALNSLLHSPSNQSQPRDPRYRSPNFDPREGYPEDWYSYGMAGREGFWQEDDPEELDQESIPESEHRQQPWSWKPLLTGLVQLATSWIQRSPRRPSLRKLLGISAIVTVLTLAAGPVVGGVAMTVGTAALLASKSAPVERELPPTTVR